MEINSRSFIVDRREYRELLSLRRLYDFKIIQDKNVIFDGILMIIAVFPTSQIAKEARKVLFEEKVDSLWFFEDVQESHPDEGEDEVLFFKSNSFIRSNMFFPLDEISSPSSTSTFFVKVDVGDMEEDVKKEKKIKNITSIQVVSTDASNPLCQSDLSDVVKYFQNYGKVKTAKEKKGKIILTYANDIGMENLFRVGKFSINHFTPKKVEIQIATYSPKKKIMSVKIDDCNDLSVYDVHKYFNYFLRVKMKKKISFTTRVKTENGYEFSYQLRFDEILPKEVINYHHTLEGKCIGRISYLDFNSGEIYRKSCPRQLEIIYRNSDINIDEYFKANNFIGVNEKKVILDPNNTLLTYEFVNCLEIKRFFKNLFFDPILSKIKTKIYISSSGITWGGVRSTISIARDTSLSRLITDYDLVKYFQEFGLFEYVKLEKEYIFFFVCIIDDSYFKVRHFSRSSVLSEDCVVEIKLKKVDKWYYYNLLAKRVDESVIDYKIKRKFSSKNNYNPENIYIMTFNILGSGCVNYINNYEYAKGGGRFQKVLFWDNRKKIVKQDMFEHMDQKIDIICCQELTPGVDLAKLGYEVHKRRNCGIYYRSERIELVSTSDIFFRMKCKHFSNRVGLLAKFRHLKSDKFFYVCNVHFDHKYIEQNEQSDVVFEETSELCDEKGEHVVICGDFNSDPSSPIVQKFKQKFTSCYEKQESRMSFFGEYQRLIDYIFVSKGIECCGVLDLPEKIEYKNLKLPNLHHGSDHLPLLACLKILPSV